jgi:hypothetical protein
MMCDAMYGGIGSRYSHYSEKLKRTPPDFGVCLCPGLGAVWLLHGFSGSSCRIQSGPADAPHPQRTVHPNPTRSLPSPGLLATTPRRGDGRLPGSGERDGRHWEWEAGRTYLPRSDELFASVPLSSMAVRTIGLRATPLIWEGDWDTARRMLQCALQFSGATDVLLGERQL